MHFSINKYLLVYSQTQLFHGHVIGTNNRTSKINSVCTYLKYYFSYNNQRTIKKSSTTRLFDYTKTTRWIHDLIKVVGRNLSSFCNDTKPPKVGRSTLRIGKPKVEEEKEINKRMAMDSPVSLLI